MPIRSNNLTQRKNIIYVLLVILFTTACSESTENTVSLDDSDSSRIVALEITHIESPAFGGHEFGTSGQYEILSGHVTGELNPAHTLNTDITNLNRAPRNINGMVEYSSDIYILKPVDLSRGNGVLFYDVPNRGNKLGLRLFQGGATNNPKIVADMGNAFLLNQGYTIVWSGWQGNLKEGDNRLTALFPTATNSDGSSITEWITTQFTFTTEAFSVSFEGQNSTPYRAVKSSMVDATLYRRSGIHAPPELIPRSEWSFAKCNKSGELEFSDSDICLPRGFSPDFAYDLVYEAKDPIVMGIGFAAVRDLVSFLKYDQSALNPLTSTADTEDPWPIKSSLVFGTSQSGRFVRDFIYQGFNEDGQNRPVFDGAIPQVAGSRRTFTNDVFSMPGRFSMYVRNHFAPGDQFPFAYTTTTDPFSGRVDGLLQQCKTTNTCPKIMHWDSGSEAWAGRSSLVVTDPLGTIDLKIPDNVRIYQFASTQHLDSAIYGPDTGPYCKYEENNSNSFLELQRALLVALEKWVTEDKTPPPSQYPKLADKTLVSPRPQAQQGFPDIPTVEYAAKVNDLAVNNYDELPWQHTADRYPALVPKVDSDGNDIAGLRSVTTEVPLGTYTGWNIREEGFMEGEGCYLTGMFIPFAKTIADRGSDPRSSLEERYGTHTNYVQEITEAATRLQEQGYLLKEDAEQFIHRAKTQDIGLPAGN
tara:strand:+ start:21994 stop:24093 length:2100 start_codon:yes stop_codon:yes gene_type:complete